MATDFILPILLVLTLIAAVCHDLATHRLPNALTAGALTAALAIQALEHGLHGMLLALGGAAIGLAALLPFYLRREMGAGDVKLMAAMGAILGPLPAVYAVGISLIAGAILALGIHFRAAAFSFLFASLPTKALKHVGDFSSSLPPESGRQKFPYSPAIALGSVLAAALAWAHSI